MSIDLTKTLHSDDVAKDTEFAKIADEIQGNILKSHGRGHTAHLFFRFNAGKQKEAKDFIAQLGNKDVFSAKRQKAVTEQFKNGQPIAAIDEVFVTFYLSKTGYQYLGLPVPTGLKGMKESQQILNDPPYQIWEEGFTGDIHAMILLAWGTSGDDVSKQQSRLPLEERTNDMINLLHTKDLATILSIERGDGIKGTGTADDIEHFGYVDGISQPKFFEDDQPYVPNFWNSMMPPGLVLVKDEAVGTNISDNAYGSFFVFRKLEQNVKGFKSQEQALATELDLQGEDRERAGAMVIGRFENGMPITVNDEDTKPPIISTYNAGKVNDFNYNDDTLAAKCPFHAHVRKSNPRGEARTPDPKPDTDTVLQQDKNRMMARRGIIYGKRNKHPNDEPIAEMPEGGVGLLFMSFQSSLENQFEHVQGKFVNDSNFVHTNTGVDPVIGQGLFFATQKYAAKYNDANSMQTAKPFGGFVTLKGGEYFFAPSIAFLQKINQLKPKQ